MTDVHSLSGAFVLDALDERERASFSRHMETCEACALEVAELQETAARLADDVWSVPPPRMREAVLARVATTRQEPPKRGARAPRPHRQSWRHRTTMALAAASIIGLASLSGVFYVQAQQATEERDRYQAMVTAPDAALLSSQVRGGGQLTVLMVPSRDAAIVELVQAPKVDADHAFQLWKIVNGQPTSAGVMPAGKGDGSLYVTGLAGTEVLAVTIEPKAGSRLPTTAIAAQVTL